jgi:signal transduction histidine kinase
LITAIWFISSDIFLRQIQDSGRHTLLHTYKDLFYVLITAPLLYGLLVRELRGRQEIAAAGRQMLEQQVEARTRELMTLLQVSGTVTSTLELTPLLELILDQLKSVVDYTGAAMALFENDDLTVSAFKGGTPRRMSLPLRVPGRLLQNYPHLFDLKQPLIIPDIEADTPVARLFRELFAGQLHMPLQQVRAWLSVPMTIKERTIGFLNLAHTQPGYYSSHQAELTAAFAGQAAIAVENARLYARTSQHSDELETMFAVQQAITSRLDPDSVLQLIANAARRLTSTPVSIVYLLEEDQLRVAVMSGHHNSDIAVGYCLPLDQSVTGLAIRSGQPVVVADAEDDIRVYADMIRRLGARCYLAVPLVSGVEPVGAIAVADPQPGKLGADEERILTMLASGAVIGLENARLYREEQERRREAEQRRRVAETLRDLIALLNSDRSLTEILNYTVRQAGDLLDAAAAAVFRLEAESYTVQASRGLSSEQAAQTHLLLDQAGLRQALLQRRPVVLPDLTLPDPAKQIVNDYANIISGFQTLLVAPLISNKEVYGNLALYYPEPRPFSEDEIDLVLTFCEQAALAIENARLKAQVEQTAVAAERGRLARDLHDAVTQTLFSASLIAEVLPRLWEKNQPETLRRLEELRQLTRGALAEMRTLLLELRPAALTEAKLSELLRHLTQAITGRARTPITLEIEGECLLPPEVQVSLYRITQEALNNIGKHARAEAALVQLHCRPDGLRLLIRDNGRGFDPAQVSSEHLGLDIMRERAQAIGACLDLRSAPGQGTQIELSWSNHNPTGRYND